MANVDDKMHIEEPDWNKPLPIEKSTEKEKKAVELSEILAKLNDFRDKDRISYEIYSHLWNKVTPLISKSKEGTTLAKDKENIIAELTSLLLQGKISNDDFRDLRGLVESLHYKHEKGGQTKGTTAQADWFPKVRTQEKSPPPQYEVESVKKTTEGSEPPPYEKSPGPAKKGTQAIPDQTQVQKPVPMEIEGPVLIWKPKKEEKEIPLSPEQLLELSQTAEVVPRPKPRRTLATIEKEELAAREAEKQQKKPASGPVISSKPVTEARLSPKVEPTEVIQDEKTKRKEEIQAAYDRGNFQTAVEQLAKLLEKEPEARLYYFMGECLLKQNNLSKSLENFRQAYEKDPSPFYGNRIFESVQEYCQIHYAEIDNLLLLGKYEEAKKSYDMLMGLVQQERTRSEKEYEEISKKIVPKQIQEPDPFRNKLWHARKEVEIFKDIQNSLGSCIENLAKTMAALKDTPTFEALANKIGLGTISDLTPDERFLIDSMKKNEGAALSQEWEKMMGQITQKELDDPKSGWKKETWTDKYTNKTYSFYTKPNVPFLGFFPDNLGYDSTPNQYVRGTFQNFRQIDTSFCQTDAPFREKADKKIGFIVDVPDPLKNIIFTICRPNGLHTADTMPPRADTHLANGALYRYTLACNLAAKYTGEAKKVIQEMRKSERLSNLEKSFPSLKGIILEEGLSYGPQTKIQSLGRALISSFVPQLQSNESKLFNCLQELSQFHDANPKYTEQNGERFCQILTNLIGLLNSLGRAESNNVVKMKELLAQAQKVAVQEQADVIQKSGNILYDLQQTAQMFENTLLAVPEDQRHVTEKTLFQSIFKRVPGEGEGVVSELKKIGLRLIDHVRKNQKYLEQFSGRSLQNIDDFHHTLTPQELLASSFSRAEDVIICGAESGAYLGSPPCKLKALCMNRESFPTLPPKLVRSYFEVAQAAKLPVIIF